MKTYLFLFGAFLMFQLNAQNPAGSPVATHGLLKTKGNRIVGSADTAVSIAGNSLFWSQWSGQFYNANVVKWLKTDWNSKIIRAAMGVDETGGYITNPATEKQKVFTIVDACIAEGLYVIIDWHSHHAEKYKTESIAFFKEMATKYGQYPNVIYEIYNEPLDTANWNTKIKPYAVDVISEIRKIDPDNLILVGTRNWSQEVVEAANNPINDVNVAYVLHFYVGMHGKYLRDKALDALNKGIPLFVSEWGLWGSDSDLENWVNFMKDNKLSWCNWSVFTKVEPSSALTPNASSNGSWTDKDLTLIGKKVRNYMLNWPSWTPLPVEPCTLKTEPFKVMNLPGIVEAENFDAGCQDSSYHDTDDSNLGTKFRTTGVDIESCTDAGGGFNLGYLEADEWLNYTVNIKESGTYQISARVAAMNAGGRMRLQLDGVDISSVVNVPATKGWQTWTDVQFAQVNLNAKDSVVLKLKILTSGFNLNKLIFTNLSTGINDQSELAGVTVFPSQTDNQFQIESLNEPIQQLLIYNTSGMLVSTIQNINKRTITVGDNLNSGIYSIVIQLTNGRTIPYKVHKN